MELHARLKKFDRLAYKLRDHAVETISRRFDLMLESMVVGYNANDSEITLLRKSFRDTVEHVLTNEFLHWFRSQVERCEKNEEKLARFASHSRHEVIVRSCATAISESLHRLAAKLRKSGGEFVMQEADMDDVLHSFHQQTKDEIHFCDLTLRSMARPKLLAKAREPEPEKKFVVRDILGRFILKPLEQYALIHEKRLPGHTKSPVFCRCFCKPMLDNLQSYVIGVEKYRQYNEYYLRMVRKMLDAGTVDKITVDSFFENKKVRATFSIFLMRILRKFEHDERRENVINLVNKQLRHVADGGKHILFKEEDVRVLTEAWAAFICEHMNPATLKDSDRDILQKLTPELVVRLSERAKLEEEATA